MPASRPLALVTGASSGIGEALAVRLAGDGYDLVLVARRRERLEALAARLDEHAGATSEVLVADLTDDADLRRVEQRAALGLDLLVNNAGFAGYGPFAEIDPDVASHLVGIHVLAPVRLTRAALPPMVARGSGAIVNVASLLALSGPLQVRMAGRATYAGAKSFLLTFTQALAGELEGSGIQAMVCLPGMTESEFHGGRDLRAHGVKLMSSEDVAAAIVAGLRNGETVCAPGVEPASLFEELATLQRQVLSSGNATGELAARYRT